VRSIIELVRRNNHLCPTPRFQNRLIRNFQVARLGRTIVNLARYRRQWAQLAKAAAAPHLAEAGPSHLTEVAEFGSNPGNLRMLAYVPDNLAPSSPLVVVLHGCTQTAAGYDIGAGWSTLADRYGFALLFPEQRQANNPKLCFNWFQAGDIKRGRGEPLSIRQMIERMVGDHAIDNRRIFVTGLSAGGAMTGVMLATYPEVFAGGAVIAGLPYGSATSVKDAFEAMYQGRARPAGAWGDLVRAASPHRGPWPKLSVWHGSADATVIAGNADEILKQWRDVQGLPPQPTLEETVDGYPRQVWRNEAGQDVIESFTITSMAHGTPLATGDGENAYGSAGPFLLDVGISSTYRIAKFWGLTDGIAKAAKPTRTIAAPNAVAAATRPVGDGRSARPQPSAATRGGTYGPIDVQAVIDRALKAAGLIR
jgi:poly(hydroxyalkanoate) depolymerase family esterase